MLDDNAHMLTMGRKQTHNPGESKKKWHPALLTNYCLCIFGRLAFVRTMGDLENYIILQDLFIFDVTRCHLESISEDDTIKIHHDCSCLGEKLVIYLWLFFAIFGIWNEKPTFRKKLKVLKWKLCIMQSSCTTPSFDTPDYIVPCE